ncbi:MAG: hypothetical protein WB809_03620 [Thermoplasmata archaeon]
MNVPSDWPLLILVAAATVIAILAGRALEIAVPVGVVAVVAAGLLLAGSMRHLAWRPAPSPRMAPPMAASTLRAAFRSGRSGRITIVVELDRIERMGPHPSLSVRTEAEESRIRALPRPEFRAYVQHRLDAIEAADR